MNKCPRCRVPLLRTQISSVNVRQCGKCQGNLLTRDRLNRIAAASKRTVNELMTDWRSYLPIDTSGKCRCPECRSKMYEEKKLGGVKFDHYQCINCKLIWIDPGELELYLLAYQTSEKGQEAKRLKEIHQNMTDHERAKLQALIDALPENLPDERSNTWLDYLDIPPPPEFLK